MTVHDLLKRANQMGVVIVGDKGQLVLRGARDAVCALVPEARLHKRELLTLVPGVPPRNHQGDGMLPGDTAPLRATNAIEKPLPDAEGQSCYRRLLELQSANPGALYTLVTDAVVDPKAIILSVGIRGRATLELRIPREKYDAFLLLALLERHSARVH